MAAVLVDSNVILDVFTRDPTWYDWSAAALEDVAGAAPLAINAIVYGEFRSGSTASRTSMTRCPRIVSRASRSPGKPRSPGAPPERSLALLGSVAARLSRLL